jgi:NADH-quinone oxidoreductase subunit A
MGNHEIFAVIIYIVLAVGMAVTLVALVRFVTWRLGTGVRTKGKAEPYECGMPLLSGARQPFGVKFYLIALMFVLFDVEIALLLPYAVASRKLGVAGFVEMFAFVAVLGLGLLYLLKRRALELD